VEHGLSAAAAFTGHIPRVSRRLCSKAVLPRGMRFFQWQFDSVWKYIADGGFKGVCFTWKILKVLNLGFSKTLCS